MPEHIHKYRRKKLGADGSYIVYACALPDCTHYISRELVEGKESICWQCGNEMVMDAIAIRRAKPKCLDCRAGRKVESIKGKIDFDKILEDLKR